MTGLLLVLCLDIIQRLALPGTTVSVRFDIYLNQRVIRYVRAWMHGCAHACMDKDAYLSACRYEAGTLSLSPALKEMAFDSRIHAHHATRVIANVLDFAKICAGKLALREEPFELRAMADAALAPLRATCLQLHETARNRQ